MANITIPLSDGLSFYDIITLLGVEEGDADTIQLFKAFVYDTLCNFWLSGRIRVYLKTELFQRDGDWLAHDYRIIPLPSHISFDNIEGAATPNLIFLKSEIMTVFKEIKEAIDDLFIIENYSIKRRENLLGNENKPTACQSTEMGEAVTHKARTSYLIIIAALCSKKQQVDITAPSAVSIIRAEIEKIGLRLCDDTIRKIIKEVKDITNK